MRKILLGLITIVVVCSCSNHESHINENDALVVNSFSARLVHPSNPQIADTSLLTGMDLTGYFVMTMDQRVRRRDLSIIYWVSREQLLVDSDLKSVSVKSNLGSDLIMSREEYAELERLAQETMPGSTMTSYGEHLKRNTQSQADTLLTITLTEGGLIKLNRVARKNQKVRVAIIINNELIWAPFLSENIESAMLTTKLDCTLDQVKKLITAQN